MGEAWPRFLPRPTPEAIAHALIIEACAILVEEFREGHGDLFRAHKRAEAFARERYSEEALQHALDACAAAPDNESTSLHYVMRFVPDEIETVSDTMPMLSVVAASNSGRMRPRVCRQPHRAPRITSRPALAAIN